MHRTVTAISALQYFIENETDVVVGQIEVLERITHNATERYSTMTDLTCPCVEAARSLKKSCEKLANGNDFQDIDRAIGELDSIVSEIEEWTSELDVKSRRLQND